MSKTPEHTPSEEKSFGEQFVECDSKCGELREGYQLASSTAWYLR